MQKSAQSEDPRADCAAEGSCGCSGGCPMKYLAWGLVILLIVLHQDFWNWTDGTLLFGVVPIGLAYHVGLSLAAGVAWWLVVRTAWPQNLSSPSGDQPPQESDA